MESLSREVDFSILNPPFLDVVSPSISIRLPISVSFHTKKEQFNQHYGMFVKQGLYERETQISATRFDSVFYEFDNLAVELIFSGLAVE